MIIDLSAPIAETKQLAGILEDRGIVYLRNSNDPAKICQLWLSGPAETEIEPAYALFCSRFTLKLPYLLFPDENVMSNLRLAEARQVINAFLFGRPVQEGAGFQEWINHGYRNCTVTNVKRLRYRIEFDMPNCIQEGWRHGVLVGGKLYYKVSP